METLVPGRMPRAGLLLLSLLLCFGPESTRSIKLKALKVIVKYVNGPDKINDQYAFVASLPHDTCRNPLKDIKKHLPKGHLKNMREEIRQNNRLYNKGNIVAAQPIKKGDYTEHSEWRLLSGENSLVSQLKARTYNNTSCLILFTLSSPCTSKCLNTKGHFNILQMTSNAFLDIDNNFKAFVFQRIFWNDMNNATITRQQLLEAWHLLKVPLLRCDNNSCQDCAGPDKPDHPNPCLEGKS